MNAASIFEFGNAFVLIAWVALILLPHWAHTFTLARSVVIVVISVLYAILISQGINELELDSFNTLESVKKLFQSDMAVAAGWLHYLAFDLLAGTYILQKSKEIGLPRWQYSLALPFTFIFGPIGYLIFFLFKTLKTASWKD